MPSLPFETFSSARCIDAWLPSTESMEIECDIPRSIRSSFLPESPTNAFHHYGRRPAHPTPTRGRMASSDRDSLAHAVRNTNSGLSISAIPGPTDVPSRSTRRAVSIRKSSKSCLTPHDPLLSPDKAKRLGYRKSIGIKKDTPSNTFQLSRNLVSKSESTISYFEDLTCVNGASEAFSAKPPTSNQRLTKSSTTSALPSPHTAISSRRLLRPVDPPLPRPGTIDNLSPARTNKTAESVLMIQHTSVPCVVKPREHGARSKSPHSTPTFLSVSPPPRFQYGSVEQHSRQAPFEGTEDRGQKFLGDPRSVTTYEGATYWLGRYITTLNQLRTKEFVPHLRINNINKISSLSALKLRNSVDFDRAEKIIQKKALQSLESSCKSKEALKSLKAFEKVLGQCGELEAKGPSITPPLETTTVSRPGNQHPQCNWPPMNPASSKARKLSETLPQSIFRKAPSNLLRNVSKSSTSSNRGNSVLSIPNQTDTPRQVTRTMNNSDQVLQYPVQISEARLRAVQERDGRPRFARPPEARRLTNIASDSYGEARYIQGGSPIPLNTQVSDGMRNPDLLQTSGPNNLAQDLASVDGRVSEKPQTELLKGDIFAVGTGEAPAGVTRKFRKSESMKRLVDAGVREIKRMGHRVSNPGSHDGMPDKS